MTDIDGCEDALRLLAAHLDRELSPAATREVEHHLETCRSCWSRAEFEKQLKTSLSELGIEPVRPELADRIQKMIGRFVVSGGGPAPA